MPMESNATYILEVTLVVVAMSEAGGVVRVDKTLSLLIVVKLVLAEAKELHPVGAHIDNK